MKNRNIAVAIILSFLTCGLYSLYWESQINEEVITKNPTEFNQDYIIVFLLTLLTCGIYHCYWSYKMGKGLMIDGASDNSVLYLFLGLFGFSLISMAIMQGDINKVYK